MSKEAFEVKAGMGPSGHYRDIHGGDTFRLIGEIEAFMANNGRERYQSDNVLHGPYEGLQESLSGSRRPCDRYILNPDRFTQPEAIKSSEWQDNQIRNRLVVDASITGAGNLSVTFAPYYLGEDGEWKRAEEWKKLETPTFPRAGDRPLNEILFVRGVEPLFDPSSNTDFESEFTRELSLARRAVLVAYREAVHRLKLSFNVQENDCLVALYADQKTAGARCLGLEIVKGHDEYRKHVAAIPERFSAKTGLDAQLFWTARQAIDGNEYTASERLSKKLRVKGTMTADLTPGAVREWIGEFERAHRYGVLEFAVPSEPSTEASEPTPGMR